jgi:hypothetical protein
MPEGRQPEPPGSAATTFTTTPMWWLTTTSCEPDEVRSQVLTSERMFAKVSILPSLPPLVVPVPLGEACSSRCARRSSDCAGLCASSIRHASMVARRAGSSSTSPPSSASPPPGRPSRCAASRRRGRGPNPDRFVMLRRGWPRPAARRWVKHAPPSRQRHSSGSSPRPRPLSGAGSCRRRRSTRSSPRRGPILARNACSWTARGTMASGDSRTNVRG